MVGDLAVEVEGCGMYDIVHGVHGVRIRHRVEGGTDRSCPLEGVRER